jgi:F-type H+-transporting ATPase subunit b
LISVDATALIITALVFALVLALKNLFFEPLAQAMESRKERIDRAESAWGDAQKTIEAASTRVSAAVTAARNEGYGLLDRERAEAQTNARAGVERHRDEAQREVAEAKRRLEEEGERAVRELEGEADALARSLASRILGREVA